MPSLEHIVYRLLHNYDCVIIPGFGGFITRESPAAVNHLNHTVKPYTKTIFFNLHLKDNDGLLAKAVSDETGMDYDTAMGFIKSWVDKHEAILEDVKSFKFDDLGAFYLNNDGRKWFSPAYKLNVNKRTFGLEAVPAYEIERLEIFNTPEQTVVAHTPETEETTVSLADRKAIEPVEKYSSNWRSLLVAASVAILAHVGYTWIETGQSSGGQSASMLPTVSNTETTAIIQSETETMPADTAMVSPSETVVANDPALTEPAVTETMPVQTKESAEAPKMQLTPEVKPEVKTEAIQTQAAAPVSEAAYYLVYGSYLLAENASNLQSDLLKSGIQVSILRSESGGHVFSRVVGSSYTSQQEAAEALNAILSDTKPTIVNIQTKSIITE